MYIDSVHIYRQSIQAAAPQTKKHSMYLLFVFNRLQLLRLLVYCVLRGCHVEEEASNKTQVGMLTCDIDICLCRSNKSGFITVLADGGIDSIADSSNSFVKKKICLEEQITE